MAEIAIDFVTRANRKIAEDLDSVFLGVTSQDLNIKSAGWQFATNYRLGRFAIISTARLHGMPWFAGPNPEAFPVRVRKMVTKNVALLRYPVGLSADPTSGLAASVFTASDVDQMGEDFVGEKGTWSSYPAGAPCFSITQGPHGRQSWRTDCTGDPPTDSRFETFENYTDITLLVMARTDFPFDSQRYLSFIRKYRPQDNRSRSFGIGGNDSFDIFPAGDSQTFSTIDLILADGGRVYFNRVSRGTGYADAKLRADGVYMGTPFNQSHLEWNGNGWDLKTVDGWTYKFPSSGPDRSAQQSALLRVETGAGAISIQRNSAGALQRAEAPDGSWINFTCDSKNRVILAQHSSGHAIRYEYDSGGRLTHVVDSADGEEFYQYDPVNRLTSVLDSKGRSLLVNTYGYLGEVTSQTLADHRKLRYEYGFDEKERCDEVDCTDDHGYVTRWMRGRDGFYGSLPQPPKQ
jgi:YD repeat-containing protein